MNNDNNEPSLQKQPFDAAAFEALFKENFEPLCIYCQYKFDFDLDLAKEIVQTAFIKLWESRQAVDANLSIKAYLYRIVNNNCFDFLKHEAVKKKYEQAMELRTETVSGFSDVKQLQTDIEKALENLPSQMRKIFELSRYEGLKYTEIAQHLNISVKTVETQMSRALFKLRQQLAKYLILLLILMNKG